jgi:ribosomal-protein-alanine N-acetyltransferase
MGVLEEPIAMASILSGESHSWSGIQPANLRDLNTLRRLEQVCFPKDAWPLLDLVGVLSMPNIVRLKAVDGDRLVGFVAADVRATQNIAWIATIGVLPEYRRRKVATTLLESCEGRLKVGSVRLSVRGSNEAALKLYTGLGYAEIGAWPGYYQDGEDALVFEKRLDGRQVAQRSRL